MSTLSNNTTLFETTSAPSATIGVLNAITNQFVNNLPLAFTILGLIGFVGNAFTFLQPALRSNTCCIYILCSSVGDIINLFVNLFPNFLVQFNTSWPTWQLVRAECKCKLFALVFLPQLSTNFLILSLIDRFASTSSLTSSIRRLCHQTMVPWLIGITVVVSCLMSLYAPILNDLAFSGCVSTNPMLNSILYIVIHGIIPPIVMLIFVLLTYRNTIRSRRRVGIVATANPNRSRNQFVGMIFVQIVGTAFFSLQWISMYMYDSATQNDIKNNEQRTIDLFVYRLTNYLYYLNNVKSFFFSTLTSHRFRVTFVTALLRLLSGGRHRQQKLERTSFSITGGTRARREPTLHRQF